jgi:Tol biopolymer transport system component
MRSLEFFGFSLLGPTLSRSLVLIASPLLILGGCGGSGPSSPTIGTQATTLVFSSNRALDGTDAPNNAPINGVLNAGGVSNIWTIKSDGSGATAITQLSGSAYPGGSSDPVWSPDGSKVVYSSARALDGSNAANNPNGTFNVWVMNAEGTGATPLTSLTTPFMDCYAPVWSPDGKKVAYFSARALDGSDTLSSNPRNIWVMNADGSNGAPVTRLTAFAADSSYPRWSPDNTMLAFSSSRALDGSDAANGAEPYTKNIWVVKIDGTGAVPITNKTNVLGDNQAVLWFRTGSQLVFSGADGNIWTAHSDGSALTALTSLTNSSSYPSDWSPDGSKLAFVSTRALDGSDNLNGQGSSNIWIMDADGSNPTALTKLTVVGAAGGVWSVGGTRIAYSSPRAFDGSDNSNAGDKFNIWLVNTDGSGTSPLTMLSKSNNIAPAWLP